MRESLNIFEKLGFSRTNKKLEIEPGLYYASFHGRLLASTIDNILCILLLVPFLSVIAGSVAQVDGQVCLQQLSHATSWPELFAIVFEYCFTPGWMLNNLLQIAIMGGVVLAFWFSKGATPGKMLMRMRIVDADTLGEPTRGQYYLRFFGYFLSMFPLGLGFLAIIWNKRKQGWHDSLARTLVIVDKRKKSPSKGSA